MRAALLVGSERRVSVMVFHSFIVSLHLRSRREATRYSIDFSEASAVTPIYNVMIGLGNTLLRVCSSIGYQVVSCSNFFSIRPTKLVQFVGTHTKKVVTLNL